MKNSIPTEVRTFFGDNSVAWRERLKNVETYEHLRKEVEGLQHEDARELLGVAVSYVSAALNEISIYQNALNRLERGESESSVDTWLDEVGFHVEHNQLGRALVNRVAGLFQNVIQVIQNFIQHIMAVLTMTLDEVSFTFSASPSVSLKFK